MGPPGVPDEPGGQEPSEHQARFPMRLSTRAGQTIDIYWDRPLVAGPFARLIEAVSAVMKEEKDIRHLTVRLETKG